MSNLSTTSDDILDCARSLIVEGGYNGFSYADIAGVVGIRKASIHHHFPSKADLVRALVKRYREETELGMANLERNTADPLRLLQAYVNFWKECIEDSRRPFCICALLASELPILPPDVASEVRLYFRSLSAWMSSVLERGMRQGMIELSSPPRVEAEAFMATVHGAMLSARAYGDPQMFGVILAPVLQRLSPSQNQAI